MKLTGQALETRLFRPREALLPFVLEHVPSEDIHEGMILAVTSKIVSLAEGRLVPKSQVSSKNDLVRQEADAVLDITDFDIMLTLKEGLLIPSAGIDESNAQEDAYILYPQDPFLSAQKLWETLRQAWSLNHLGILITDSHTTPLRRGVTGIALSFWGFKPVSSLIGHPDLFGKPFRVTSVNHADALASLAVYTMGEGLRPQPLALIQGTQSELEFCSDDCREQVQITPQEDLYRVLYQGRGERLG